MARSQLGGTIGTEVHRQVVLAVVVVGDAAEVGHDRPLGPAGGLAAEAALVAAAEAPDLVVVLGVEVAAGTAELLPVGGGGGGTGHHVQVVLPGEGVLVGQDVVVDHAAVVAAGVRRLAVLGAAVAGLDRVQVVPAVDPAAVHGHRALEVQLLGEVDLRVAGEDGAVGGVEIALAAGHVLGRRGVAAQAVERVVVLFRVLRIPHERVSRGVDDGEDDAGAVRARTGDDAVVLVVGVGHVRAHGEPLVHVHVEAGAHVVAAGVGDLDDTLLVGVAAADVVAELVGAAGNAQLVVLGDAGLVGVVEPVGLVLEARGDIDIELLRVFAVLVHVQDFIGTRHVGHAHVRGEVHLRGLVAAALLGGDEHDAVRRAGTIDGRGGGVLEDLHRLYVVRGEVRDGVGTFAHGDTVHDVQRVVGRCDGTVTADADRHAGARKAAGLLDLDAGHLALDEAGSLGNGPQGGVFGGNDGHGRGEVLLAHGAVADGHDGVQREGFFLDGHVDDGTGTHGLCDGAVAQRIEHEHGLRSRDRNGIPAVSVGHGAVLRPLLQDRDADPRIAGPFRHRARNGPPLCIGCYAQKHHYEYNDFFHKGFWNGLFKCTPGSRCRTVQNYGRTHSIIPLFRRKWITSEPLKEFTPDYQAVTNSPRENKSGFSKGRCGLMRFRVKP